MNKNIVIRGIKDHEAEKESNSIRNYINEHFAKIEKLFNSVKEPVSVNIAVEVAMPHPHHIVDIRIHAPNFEIIIKKEGADLYQVIDLVLDDAKRELIKHKEKVIDARKKGQ